MKPVGQRVSVLLNHSEMRTDNGL